MFESLVGKRASRIRIDKVVFGCLEAEGELVIFNAQLVQPLRFVVRQLPEEVPDQLFIVNCFVHR